MKRVLIVVAIIALIAGGAYYYRDEIRLGWLAFRGHTKVCSVTDAMRAANNERVQSANNDRIARAMRMVDRDPATGLEEWETPDGRYWMPKGSQYSLSWDLAEQERDIYGTGEHFVRNGDVVLDCGANVGVFTRKALKAGAKTVVAIEIAPENLECLRRNFPYEIRSGRVIVYPKGVWDKDDNLTLTVDPLNSAADSVVMRPEHAQKGPTVPLTTLDKIVSELRLERVDFIKMDIEGAETNALRGGRETIARWHPRMALSAYHKPDDPKDIPGLVRAAWSGYTMECGPCADAKTFVRPDVLYFY